MASVRRCQKPLPCLTEPVPAETDLPLAVMVVVPLGQWGMGKANLHNRGSS